MGLSAWLRSFRQRNANTATVARARRAGPHDGFLFNDWRRYTNPERKRMVKETHTRTGYPLGPYARITHMTRIFPSLEDHVRNAVMESNPDRAHTLRRALSSDNPEVRRHAARDWHRDVREYIRALGPDFGRKDKQRGARIDQLGRTLQSLPERTFGQSTDYRDSAADQIRLLDNLFAADGYLHASANDVEAFRTLHPEACPANFKPYKPTDLDNYRWYNFWKLDGAPSPSRRLRMNWELYTGSQNFTVYEDFGYSDGDDPQVALAGLDASPAPSAHPATSRGLFRKPQRGDREAPSLAGAHLNYMWTAADTLSEALDEYFQAQPESGRFGWLGQLATAAHYWVIPAGHFLDSLPEPAGPRIRAALLDGVGRGKLNLDAADHRTLANALTMFARDVFNYPDKTAFDRPREDFVASRVFGGRAIYLSDLRPHSRFEEDWELASRSLILDLGLSAEQRGRLIRCCSRIATSRVLALRDFEYVAEINRSLDEIGLGLSSCQSQILDIANSAPASMPGGIWHEPDAEQHHALNAEEHRELRSEYFRTLVRLRQLSANLGSLNHFITHGITGAHTVCAECISTVTERTRALREDRIPGFETLTEFLNRFRNTTTALARMERRYRILRRGITEYTQLVRTEINMLQLDSVEQNQRAQTRMMRERKVWQTAVAFAVAILSVAGEVAGTTFLSQWAGDIQLPRLSTDSPLLNAAFTAAISGAVAWVFTGLIYRLYNWLRRGETEKKAA